LQLLVLFWNCRTLAPAVTSTARCVRTTQGSEWRFTRRLRGYTAPPHYTPSKARYTSNLASQPAAGMKPPADQPQRQRHTSSIHAAASAAPHRTALRLRWGWEHRTTMPRGRSLPGAGAFQQTPNISCPPTYPRSRTEAHTGCACGPRRCAYHWGARSSPPAGAAASTGAAAVLSQESWAVQPSVAAAAPFQSSPSAAGAAGSKAAASAAPSSS